MDKKLEYAQSNLAKSTIYCIHNKTFQLLYDILHVVNIF